MKRMVAQLQDSKDPCYDPEEKGEVVHVGEHHGGSFQVYFAHKVTKLREAQAEKWKDHVSNIFNGCIMYVNGLTNPPIDELRRLICMHGGECIAYRAVKITHFVCNYFTDAQLKLERAKVKLSATNKVYYVIDGWITQCIKQGKRIDETNFIPEGVPRHSSSTIGSIFHDSSSKISSKASVSVNTLKDRDEVNKNGDKGHQAGELGLIGVLPDCDFGGGRSGDISLTASQQEFMSALPPDLLSDALAQLGSLHTNIDGATAIMNGSCRSGSRSTYNNNRKSEMSDSTTCSSSSSSSSSSSTTTNNNCPTIYSETCSNKVYQTAHVVSGGESQGRRRAELSALVQYLHHNSDGSFCRSKDTQIRIRNYLRNILHSLNELHNESNVLAVITLFTDLIKWLKRCKLYDQLEFFSSELKRQVSRYPDLARISCSLLND